MTKYKTRTVDAPDLGKFGLNPDQIGVDINKTANGAGSGGGNTGAGGDYGTRRDELFRDHEVSPSFALSLSKVCLEEQHIRSLINN